MRCLAIACLLLPCGLATAQKVGEPAPEIVWTTTHNFGDIPGKKLSELRGSVVLLEFVTLRSALPREEVAKMTALYNDKAEKGLVVVTLPIEGADEAARWVKALEIKRPVASADTKDWTNSFLPVAWLIDKDGKVLWRGHPVQLDKPQLDKALEGAKPAIVLPGLEDAQAMRRAKDFGATWKKANELLGGGQLSPGAAAQAKDWIEQYETFVKDGLAAAEKAEAAKDVYGQWAALQPIADWYQGVPGADVAKTKFTALVADPKNKKDIEAGRKFAAGKEKEAAFEFDAAYAIWKEVSTQYGNTRIGKEALAQMKAYEKDGKLGYDHSCGYCKAGGAACPQHAKKKKK